MLNKANTDFQLSVLGNSDQKLFMLRIAQYIDMNEEIGHDYDKESDKYSKAGLSK